MGGAVGGGNVGTGGGGVVVVGGGGGVVPSGKIRLENLYLYKVQKDAHHNTCIENT